MANHKQTMDELTGRDNHKFYEPIVLFKALSVATQDTAVYSDSDSSIDTQNDENIFKAFVNKLAFICDKVKSGGATISSIAVLNHEIEKGNVHYWLASNQRTDEQQQSTGNYIRSLLQRVNECPTAPFQRKTVVHNLLSLIIRESRHRVTCYLKKVAAQANECLERSSDTPVDTPISRYLRLILNITAFTEQEDVADDIFVDSTRMALRIFKQNQLTLAGKELANRAVEGRQMSNMPGIKCWSEMQHGIKRLLAYPESINFLLLAKEKWPQFFQGFAVSFISSSEPIKRPKRNKSMVAHNIIGRVVRQQDKIELYRSFAEELQRFKLDDLIKEEYQDRGRNTVVHSEILVLDFLSRTGRLSPENFFNGWMYIGSSKPTCKLCDYYFQSHYEINKVKIDYRPSHGNLYLAWRIPEADTLRGQETAEEKKEWLGMQDKIRQKVLVKVRKDAFDIVKEKTPSLYRTNDSNTFSERLSIAGWGTTTVDVDDMASMMGQMDLDGR